jgi:hypothetical protein
MPGRLFLALLILCLSCPVVATPSDPASQPGPVSAPALSYLQELIAQARLKQLAQRPEWHRLGHYIPNLLLPGVHSLADDPQFFIAPTGKTDPQAELEATLASFFSTLEETDKQQNPQCRFIARYHWLKQELQFDPGRMSEQPCRRFRSWRAALNPHEITLIFPAAYLNNPASMYGHTLLRIDAKDQDDRTRLLAYAINYAASTGETSGVLFAMNGLFGGYHGVFSIMPYYLKVREYSDIENRDIWEYQLDFTPAEIDRLLMHLWELGPVYFDYYFFDENCSYHLLSLFEVARPGLQLTDQFRWWAIPSDTVRAVTRQPGLLKRAVYRPASVSVLRHRLGLANEEERRIARDLVERRSIPADGQLRQLPAVRQAAVLELAYEYLSYQRAAKRITEAEAIPLAHELLLVRSQLDISEKPLEVPVPRVRPDEGHETARFAFTVGKNDGRQFEEIRWRAAYHNLLDPEDGYARGAQIQFFEFAARRYEHSDGLRLEELKPVDIVSLTPRSDYFQSWSWKINAGWMRKRFPDASEPLVFRLNGGPGLAWDFVGPFSGRSLIYGFLDVTLDADSHFTQGYALGSGPAAGWLVDVTKGWRASVYARTQHFSFGQVHSSDELSLNQRFTLTSQSALRVDAARKREFGYHSNSIGISWYVYF